MRKLEGKKVLMLKGRDLRGNHYENTRWEGKTNDTVRGRKRFEGKQWG